MTAVISVGLGNRRYACAYHQADTGQVPNRTARLAHRSTSFLSWT